MPTRPYIIHTVSNVAPPGSRAGDEYFDPSTNTLYKDLITNGTSPGFNQVLVVNNSGIVSVAGAISAVGNITGNYILGNGALLTGVITSVANINNGTSNVTVVSSGGNITVGVGGTANVVQWATTGEYVTGVISASGNITTGANILYGANYISGTGNIYANNVISSGTGGTLSGSGNIIAGNLLTGGNISAGGNITTGANILYGANYISGTGNVYANNVLATTIVNAASHTGTIVSMTGNIISGNNIIASTATSYISSAGNIYAAGNISATGNILFAASYLSGTGNVYAGNLYGQLANTTSNISINTAAGPAAVSIGGATNVAVFSNVTYLTMAAGNTTSAPLKFSNSATILTTQAIGAMEFSNSQLYFTPFAANRAVVSTPFFYRTGATANTTNIATGQSWLGVGVQLNANTTYNFTGVFNITTSNVNSHVEQVGFGGTATLGNIYYTAVRLNANTALGTQGNANVQYFNSNTLSNITPAITTAQNSVYQLSGTVSTVAAGSFTPQWATNVAISTTGQFLAGATFRIEPVAQGNTTVSVGVWA